MDVDVFWFYFGAVCGDTIKNHYCTVKTHMYYTIGVDCEQQCTATEMIWSSFYLPSYIAMYGERTLTDINFLRDIIQFYLCCSLIVIQLELLLGLFESIVIALT